MRVGSMTSWPDARYHAVTMSRPLPPQVLAIARAEGLDAAHAVVAGRRLKPCRWDANSGSITQAKLAAAWADAFMEEHPLPTGELPE